MEAFIAWLESIGRYFRSGTEEWYLLPLSLLGVWLLTVLWLQVRKAAVPGVKRKYLILRSWVLASVIVAAVLIVVFGYRWATTPYYPTHSSEAMNILTVFAVALAPLFAMNTLRKDLSERRINQLTQQSYGPHENTMHRLQMVRRFQHLKAWSFMSVLGFLTVLFILQKPDYLISFLFDNSDSMEQHFVTGRSALQNTLTQLDDHSDFVVSWFTEDGTQRQLPEVMEERAWQRLNGQHALFQEPYSAIQALSGMPFGTATPLYETLWSNYLFCQEQALNRPYATKVLFVVSDGQEFYDSTASLSTFLCDHPEMGDFWTEVAMIDMSNDQSTLPPLFQKAVDCGYVLEDGRDQASFTRAINYLINPLKHDWHFIIWLAVALLLPTVIGLLLQPQKV